MWTTVHARRVRLRQINMERTNTPSVEGGGCKCLLVIVDMLFDWLSIQLCRSIVNKYKTVLYSLINS